MRPRMLFQSLVPVSRMAHSQVTARPSA
jgi:hypothetical protein